MSMLYVIIPWDLTNVPASLDTLETAKNALVSFQLLFLIFRYFLIKHFQGKLNFFALFFHSDPVFSPVIDIKSLYIIKKNIDFN